MEKFPMNLTRAEGNSKSDEKLRGKFNYSVKTQDFLHLIQYLLRIG